MVFKGRKVEATLCFLRILAILSVVPWIKGRWIQENRSLVSFLALELFSALRKALVHWCLLYPLLKKTVRRCSFSCLRWFSLETLKALVAKVLITPRFWARKWWELAWRYHSIWVSLWYTWWEKEPLSFLKRRTSRKGRLPLHSNSMVNFIELDWLLRWRKNSSNFSLPWDQMTKVSSTNLNQQPKLYILTNFSSK